MSGPSARSRSVGHFLVMEILERAQALEASGRDIVHLEVGEPDFPTPPGARHAGTSAIEAGRTHYTRSLGLPALRDALATHLGKEHGADVDPERIVVTIGSSAAILLAFAALLDPGDEVIVADPGYPCYANIARSLGAVVRRVAALETNGFALDPADVRAAIGPRTKAIALNSPANPTGTLTPPETIEALAGLGPRLVSDEIYHGLVYEGTARSALELDAESFVVNGFSKRFAMTGWRLGFLVVPEPYVRHVQALQQNLFISPSDFGQWAALAALETRDELEAMRDELDARRRYLVDALERVGLRVPVRPQGAFYVFADASRYEPNSLKLALDILERVGVAVAPGIDFGPRGEGFLRFSYATRLDRMEAGIDRLADYFAGQLR